MVILLLMVGLFATRKRLKSAIFGRHRELGIAIHAHMYSKNFEDLGIRFVIYSCLYQNALGTINVLQNGNRVH